MHQFLYQHQSDAAAGHLRVDGVAAPVVHPEQLLLLVGRDADAIVLHLHAPFVAVRFGLEADAAPFGSIFQGVGEEVLQDGVHLVLVHPYAQVTEFALVGQPDVFVAGQCLEGLDCLVQVAAQFVLGGAERTGIGVGPLKVDEVGGQPQQCLYVVQGRMHVVLPLLTQPPLFGQYLQRCFNQCERGAYVVGGVDEEAYLFVGDGALPAQHDEAQDAGEQGSRQQQVERVGCRGLPEGAVDHNLQAALFQYPLFFLVGDGTDAQRILSGIQVGESDGALPAGAAPFGVVAL